MTAATGEAEIGEPREIERLHELRERVWLNTRPIQTGTAPDELLSMDIGPTPTCYPRTGGLWRPVSSAARSHKQMLHEARWPKG